MNEEKLRELNWLLPEWDAPDNVRAVMTSRHGGVSDAPFASLNLGDHVDDQLLAVARNRSIVDELLHLPSEPLWLQQVHGVDVIPMNAETCYPTGDASYADCVRQVCVVMTADCLPVLFCDEAGTQVAAAHAGWRGLCDGVLEQSVARFTEGSEVIAWLGAAIGADAFEVGGEVREAFMQHDLSAEEAFKPGEQSGKWLCDIYLLARQRLEKAGVTAVYGGGLCTYSDQERFFSYRRDGKTGRMASLIWLQEN